MRKKKRKERKSDSRNQARVILERDIKDRK